MSTLHIARAFVGVCKKCSIMNAVGIPPLKTMMLSLREFNSEPLRMVVSYGVQDLGLFAPERLRASFKDLDLVENALQGIRQCALRNAGEWYAAYDFYYTTYLYSNIEKRLLQASSTSSFRAQVNALTAQVMFRIEAIHMFFFELFLFFDELKFSKKSNEDFRKDVQDLLTLVEAKGVPELFYNDDWYLMGGIALDWYRERHSLKREYELEKAINSIRSQNAFYLPPKIRREIFEEIGSAFFEQYSK